MSIVLWLVATSLYLHAIALPVKPISDNARQRGSTAFVEAVMANAVNERVTVDRRQRRANVASIVAMVATLITFSLVLPREALLATVLLVPSPEATTACLRAPHTITGDVIAASMQSNLVEIRNATVCGDEIARIFVDSRRIVEVRVAE